MTRSARTLALAAVIVAVIASGPAAQPSPSPSADATALETSGSKHYELAEYAAAIADFKEAFRITDHPELLFNIAQAYRLSGDCRQASTFYRTYLRRLPAAPNAEKVRTRVSEMEACAAKSTEPAPIPPRVDTRPLPGPAPSRRARTWKTWVGIGALGAGAIGGGLGIAFAARGSAKADELRDTCATACTSDAALSIEAAGRAANRNAVVALAAGGVLVAAGVVLILLDRRSTETAPVTGPSVGFTGGGATATWAWSF